ncbi:methyltransferase regulatory domain-containing protein [Amorphus sp. 3PC139-8]|uniref:methyltransferase regulatory domain-containing protein n=1 Tax=Amorphus sp. 3PC139-8 TaxID=2735676 RepID=UPI00345D1CFB
MVSWTDGYVADIGYTHGYYRELSPSLLSFVSLFRGISGPQADQTLTYCELGCGQGFSANLLAAANPHIRFYVTDFNPTQIAGAKALADEAGTKNIHFYDMSFSEFEAAYELPEYVDIIAFHGVYSWISAKNREEILKFISKKLKIGGIVYCSYNCLPGWASVTPLRKLMVLAGKGEEAGTKARLNKAFSIVDKIIEADSRYFQSHSGLKERYEGIKSGNKSYISHEYFNRDWSAFAHADVAEDMARAKLTYLGSANILDHIPGVGLTAEQQKLLDQIDDPFVAETVRDYITNQQFRRDIYIKGSVPLRSLQAEQLWLGQRFALSQTAGKIQLKIKAAHGEAALQKDVYEPIIEALAQGPRTVREMSELPVVSKLGSGRLREALAVLVGKGDCQPCLSPEGDEVRYERTRALNKAILERAKDSSDLNWLCSPVTGAGIHVSRAFQLFILGLYEGRSETRDLAEYAWNILSSQNQRIVKNGKPIIETADNLVELEERASKFTEELLPILKMLRVL